MNEPITDREITDHDVTEAMLQFGGGFVKALAAAWRHGDPVNQARVKDAFPDLWQKYVDVAVRTKP